MWIQGETDQSNGTTKDAYIDYYDRMVSKINEYASEVMGEKGNCRGLRINLVHGLTGHRTMHTQLSRWHYSNLRKPEMTQ